MLFEKELEGLNEKIQTQWKKSRFRKLFENSSSFLSFMDHLEILDVHYENSLEKDDFEDAMLSKYFFRFSYKNRIYTCGSIELKMTYDNYDFSDWMIDPKYGTLLEKAEGVSFAESPFCFLEKDLELLESFFEDIELREEIETLSFKKIEHHISSIMENNPTIPFVSEGYELYVLLENGCKMKMEYNLPTF